MLSQRFGQALLGYIGLILGSNQFLLLPQLPQKILLASKVVKSDSKIIISLCLVWILDTFCSILHIDDCKGCSTVSPQYSSSLRIASMSRKCFVAVLWQNRLMWSCNAIDLRPIIFDQINGKKRVAYRTYPMGDNTNRDPFCTSKQIALRCVCFFSYRRPFDDEIWSFGWRKFRPLRFDSFRRWQLKSFTSRNSWSVSSFRASIVQKGSLHRRHHHHHHQRTKSSGWTK